jgi:23S rRNA (adenine2503-C2)-methyltransferase
MGLLRNLSAAEIVMQVFVARFILKASIRNVVFMGMGEPFDNYDQVMQAARVLNDPHGLAFGRNHVTVSTSGCIEGIYKLIEETAFRPNLAVSINAPNNLLRNKLMPVNRQHDMEALYKAMEAFCIKTKRQILIAYVLIQDFNDSFEHADELALYLEGLKHNVKINLIPYNPQSRDRYRPPSETQIDAFMMRLRQQGYYTLLRHTKGQKIMAACGQLGNLKLRYAKRDLVAEHEEASS